MSEKKVATNDAVIEYIKKFLESEKRDFMEYCYSSIKKEKDGYRYFKDSIGLMQDSEFDSLFPLVSAVIITANKIECDCLNYIISKLDGNELKKRKHALSIFEQNDLASPDAYFCKINSAYILHLNAYETGSSTPGGSADLVRFVSNNLFLRPTCIISFGICYGRDPRNQNIGDVLIPKKLYPWSIGQKITESNFHIKHDNFNLWLEEQFSQSGIYSVLNAFCNGDDGKVITSSFIFENQKQCDFAVKVTWGNMSTGEAVISSQNAKKKIREATNNEKELGGEMEGYGIAKECIFYANIPCFIIKAICDWGECKDIDTKLKGEKIACPSNLKDKLQAYAAFSAGIVLLQLLNEEEEVLLSLKLIDWMGDKKRGKYCVKKHNYVVKELLIKNIKTYFQVNEEIAQRIFLLLIKKNIIKHNQTGDLYHIN